jgi:hypothetical protein
MALNVSNGWCFDVLDSSHQHHSLSQFVKTLEIKHTLANRFQHVLPLEDVGCCGFFSHCLEVNGTVEDEGTESKDIECWLALLRLYSPRNYAFLCVVDGGRAVNIDLTIIYNH